MTFLQVLWFILIFVLMAGYFVLDGFDLGIGTVSPWLAKDDTEKAVLRRAIGPVWDGNEVWLLTCGGALFAAFPAAYAMSFSGFYLAIMLVLFGLIVRAVSFEFHAFDAGNGKLWDALFFVGSAVPALLFGVAVGNVVAGVPLNANGDYTGSFFALLNPFALICGVLGLSQMIAHGLSWTAVKTEGALHDRAVAMRAAFQIATIVLFALAGVLYLVSVTPVEDSIMPLRIVFALVVALAFVLQFLWGRQGEIADLKTFFASALTCVGLVGVAAAALFPCFVPDANGMYSITVASAASSELTLLCMTIITCIGLPLVLLYHFIVYRSFAGKVHAEEATGY
jgi:cytochrome d ubiquinol oxidase subunit II